MDQNVEFILERRVERTMEALVKNRRAFARFHPELAVEPVSLEDIMVFTVKGDAR